MKASSRFFDRFRVELDRYAPFVHLLGDPAPPAALAAATARLGELPAAYRDFVVSWNGALLFHEAIRLPGVGPDAAGGDVAGATEDARREGLAGAGEVVVAELAGGDLALLGREAETVFRVEEGSGERVPIASDLEKFLAALMIREGMVYDSEGEFREGALDADDDELTPRMAQRAEEKVIRLDQTAAFPRYEAARALRRLGRPVEAERRLREAVELDPKFAWAWFDLGRLCHAAGRPAEAEKAFVRAASVTEASSTEAAKARAAHFYAWACRAALDGSTAARAAELRSKTLALDPDIVRAQRDAATAALEEGDVESAVELAGLALALAPHDLATLELARRAKG